MEPNGILIYTEFNENFEIRPVSLELISKSVSLQEKIWNQRIMACVIGPRINYESIIQKLSEHGADEIVIVSDDRLDKYNHNYHPEIFTQIAKKYPPRIILTGATPEGKEVASYTATKLETGLTADCTNLDIGKENLLVSTRPTFGGQLTADILCRTFPQMATVQEHIFKTQENKKQPNVIFNWINIDGIDTRIELIKTIKKHAGNKDISSSKIVVAGGLGACKDNGFSLIYELAQKLKAAVGGSREAYEKGYITKAQQIGQTGKTIAPELYIAVGISGAMQHLTGIKNSGKIIAVNKDKNAPIFKHADIGIAGDLFEIMPDIIKDIDTEYKEEKNEQ